MIFKVAMMKLDLQMRIQGFTKTLAELKQMQKIKAASTIKD